jgi:hypothetical protein
MRADEFAQRIAGKPSSEATTDLSVEDIRKATTEVPEEGISALSLSIKT